LLCACASALALLPASEALADGDLDATVAGSGAGTVQSTSEALFFGSPVPLPPTVAPGEIDCDEGGGPICAANYAGPEIAPGFFAEEVRVTLSATPGPDSYFVGWSAAGASAEARCATPPEADPTCQLDLNGMPGPDATLTAVFDLLPDPPPITADAVVPGAAGHLRSLQGTVNPEGFPVTECRFEYGTTSSYGVTTPCDAGAWESDEGSSPVAVSASTEPLEPDTTYHFRLVAANIGGESFSGDHTFTTGPFPVGECPNEVRRIEQGIAALLLPNCMALEMVSPPEKGGQSAQSPVVSADGGRVKFITPAALGGPGGLSPAGDDYIASRGSGGWSSASTSQPVEFVSGWEPSGRALSYTPDLSRWFQVGSTQSQLQQGIARAFHSGLGEPFSAISRTFAPLVGGDDGDARGIRLEGASADHSRLYFEPGQDGSAIGNAYLPGDPEPAGSGARTNSYVAGLDADGQPSLALLARDRNGKAWGGNCGAGLGGPDSRSVGAVSADGLRTYFSTRPGQPATGDCTTANKLRIMRRLESPQGPWIGVLFASECTRADCDTSDGDDLFQGASTDGTRVYFTTTRQLADSDRDLTNDLYLYDASADPGERLTQVSAGDSGTPSPGEGADVLNGVAALSGDGSHVYFVAEGVLGTGLSPEGAEAQEGDANLYLWEAGGTTSFIGSLDLGAGDSLLLGGGRSAYSVPQLGDGHVLFFESHAELTAEDTDGAHRDVFRYDSAAVPPALKCASCAPGGPDSAQTDVSSHPGRQSATTDTAERQRWASEDGKSAVFTTAEGLVPGDVNGLPDFHLWHGGELRRLPGAVANTSTSDVVLSHDGSTVAFATISPLSGRDGDTANDVYVARVGGGFEEPAPSSPCDPSAAGGCLDPPAPEPSTPAIGLPAPGTGNVEPSPCRAAGQRARRLSGRARGLRLRAKKAGNPRRARRMRRAAVRTARKARRANRGAKRCRRREARQVVR
jgi:hypothetical protein